MSRREISPFRIPDTGLRIETVRVSWILLLFPVSGSRFPVSSNQVLAIIGAEPDRFCLQIVSRPDETHGLALGAHEDRMRDGRDAAVGPHTAQQRAVADPGRAEEDVLAVSQVISRKNAAQIFLITGVDQFFSFLFITR